MARASPIDKLQGGWGEGEATSTTPGAAVAPRRGQHARGGTTAAPAGVCGAGGRVGYCDVTDDGPSDCATDQKGTWPLHKKNGTGSNFIEQCKARCSRCANCNFVSVSQATSGSASACDWFTKCTSGLLQTAFGGESYTTFLVRKQRAPTWYDNPNIGRVA